MKNILINAVAFIVFLSSCGQKLTPETRLDVHPSTHQTLPGEILAQMSAEGINKLANLYREASLKGNVQQFNFNDVARKIAADYPAEEVSIQEDYGNIASDF